MNKLLIDNKWVAGGGESIVSVNPANQELVWTGTAADSRNVDYAIKAARKAFGKWSLLSFEDRYEYLERFVNILTQNKEDYAITISLENGKPLWEARTEVAGMIGKIASTFTAYNVRTGETSNVADVSSLLTHRPLGVMAVFGPFNFPGHLPNGHIMPALLAGNTVVFKPSELTPLCGELLVKHWLEAGLPKGVLNLVHGSSNTGKALVDHKDINGVLFTGSYKVGQLIHKALAGRPEVILALELGGNNPLIIDKDIYDLDAAVYHTIQSAFITSGQRCTCARRVYVPNTKMGNLFIDKLVETSNGLALSDGFNHVNMDEDGQPFMGSLISLQARDHTLKFYESLIDKHDAKILLEPLIVNEHSALLRPGIVAVKQKTGVDEECFGPLLQVHRYDDFKQAIDSANNTAYGLSAGLLSDNRANFDFFYKYIRAGIVNWNRPTTGAAGNLPFGGIGHSGNYRPSAFYAADYCAYPMASQYSAQLNLPEKLTPGINFG